jgi:hypothetical protein
MQDQGGTYETETEARRQEGNQRSGRENPREIRVIGTVQLKRHPVLLLCIRHLEQIDLRHGACDV